MRILKQNVEISCFSRNKNGISFGQQEWDQLFTTIPKQSFDQSLEKGGYVWAKTYHERYEKLSMCWRNHSIHLTIQAPKLTRRKPWNHYIPCSLDNNKQGFPQKITLWKSHPVIHSVLPTTLKLPDSILWGKKELIPRSIHWFKL